MFENHFRIIKIDYGKTPGTPHRSKPLSAVVKAEGPLPDWFQAGAEAALRTAPLHALASFAKIWAILSEHAPEDDGRPNRQSQDLQTVKNMVGFIQKNYRNKLSLSDIAFSGAVGQSKCCRLFARYFSQSPTEYLNRYRISKSLDLLRSTDLSVTEIALSAGFGSASYYAETFRQHLGKSPREFRNEFRNSLNPAGTK